MIIHTIDIVQSLLGGLIATLEPHELERSLAVECVSLEYPTGCAVDECQTSAAWLMQVHRRHSRRASEDLDLCAAHLEAHRAGDVLRIRVESRVL